MIQNILLGHEHRRTQTLPARYDRHLVNRHVSVIHHRLHQGVTRFVISGDLAVLLVHQLAALSSKGNLVAGLIEVLHLNHLLVVTRRNEGALIQEIRQIRAGETGRIACHVFEVHFLRERDFLGVYLQDLMAAV